MTSLCCRKERGRERVNKKRWREEGTGGRRRLDSDQSTPSRRTSAISYPDDSGGPDDPMVSLLWSSRCVTLNIQGKIGNSKPLLV